MKSMSYKAIFAINITQDLKLEQRDVCIAFFYKKIDEEAYVEQLIGQKQESNFVCLLNKALYRLKQLPCIWFHTFTSILKELGFILLLADLAVFDWATLYIAVYIDDFLLAGLFMSEILIIKDKLSVHFDISDISSYTYYLGIFIWHKRPMRSWMKMMKVLLLASRNHGQWQAAVTSKYLDLSKKLNICFYFDFRPKLRNIEVTYIPR